MYLPRLLWNFIDTNASPKIDTDLAPQLVTELGDINARDVQHEMHGILRFDPLKLIPFRTDAQKNGEYQDGNDLRRLLMRENRIRLNANVLDHLLKYPHLIESEYRPYRLFFWGTRFFTQKGWELVRYLEWDPRLKVWESDSMCADADFGPDDAVALYDEPLV